MPRYETVEPRVDDELIAAGKLGTIIAPVWWGIDVYNGPQEYKRSQQRFSEPQLFVFAIHWYIAEVRNGGHKQFYGNSTGIVWRDACKAFAAVGVKKGASIIFDSADLLGGDPSMDRGLRNTQLAEHAPDFGEVDRRFYELSKLVDLDAIMLAYIRDNADAFHFSGKITRVVLPSMPNRKANS